MTVKKDDKLYDVKKEPYPWHLLLRTCALLVSFTLLGLCDNIVGPTLLDLKDLYKVSVGDVSFIIMLSAIGSFIGCFAVGLVMDKLKRFRYLVMGLDLVELGVSEMLYPLFPHIAGLYTTAFFKGMGAGFLDAGGNVLLLQTWKGRDSGPYMHALHFTFGLGAFLAPVLARPFLSNKGGVETLHGNVQTEYNSSMENSTDFKNNTAFNDNSYEDINNELDDSLLTIKFLYPLVGSLPIIVSTVFILYFILDERKNKSTEDDKESSNEDKEDAKKNDDKMKFLGLRMTAIIMLHMIFYFLYVGLEVAFGTFIAVFAVECKLGMTRKQGSDLSAVFWGVFAGSRALAIPAAIILPPDAIMCISFLSCIGGSLVLSIYGESSIEVLFACTALMGFGMASIFATGLLWLEKRIEITNRIGAAMSISASLGAKVFPVVVGNIVEAHPMSLMYFVFVTSTGCTLLFVLNTVISRQLLKEKECKDKTEADKKLQVLDDEDINKSEDNAEVLLSKSIEDQKMKKVFIYNY